MNERKHQTPQRRPARAKPIQPDLPGSGLGRAEEKEETDAAEAQERTKAAKAQSETALTNVREGYD